MNEKKTNQKSLLCDIDRTLRFELNRWDKVNINDGPTIVASRSSRYILSDLASTEESNPFALQKTPFLSSRIIESKGASDDNDKKKEFMTAKVAEVRFFIDMWQDDELGFKHNIVRCVISKRTRVTSEGWTVSCTTTNGRACRPSDFQNPVLVAQKGKKIWNSAAVGFFHEYLRYTETKSRTSNNVSKIEPEAHEKISYVPHGNSDCVVDNTSDLSSDQVVAFVCSQFFAPENPFMGAGNSNDEQDEDASFNHDLYVSLRPEIKLEQVETSTLGRIDLKKKESTAVETMSEEAEDRFLIKDVVIESQLTVLKGTSSRFTITSALEQVQDHYYHACWLVDDVAVAQRQMTATLRCDALTAKLDEDVKTKWCNKFGNIWSLLAKDEKHQEKMANEFTHVTDLWHVDMAKHTTATTMAMRLHKNRCSARVKKQRQTGGDTPPGENKDKDNEDEDAIAMDAIPQQLKKKPVPKWASFSLGAMALGAVKFVSRFMWGMFSYWRSLGARDKKELLMEALKEAEKTVVISDDKLFSKNNEQHFVHSPMLIHYQSKFNAKQLDPEFQKRTNHGLLGFRKWRYYDTAQRQPFNMNKYLGKNLPAFIKGALLNWSKVASYNTTASSSNHSGQFPFAVKVYLHVIEKLEGAINVYYLSGNLFKSQQSLLKRALRFLPASIVRGSAYALFLFVSTLCGVYPMIQVAFNFPRSFPALISGVITFFARSFHSYQYIERAAAGDPSLKVADEQSFLGSVFSSTTAYVWQLFYGVGGSGDTAAAADTKATNQETIQTVSAAAAEASANTGQATLTNDSLGSVLTKWCFDLAGSLGGGINKASSTYFTALGSEIYRSIQSLDTNLTVSSALSFVKHFLSFKAWVQTFRTLYYYITNYGNSQRISQHLAQAEMTVFGGNNPVIDIIEPNTTTAAAASSGAGGSKRRMVTEETKAHELTNITGMQTAADFWDVATVLLRSGTLFLVNHMVKKLLAVMMNAKTATDVVEEEIINNVFGQHSNEDKVSSQQQFVFLSPPVFYVQVNRNSEKLALFSFSHFPGNGNYIVGKWMNQEFVQACGQIKDDQWYAAAAAVATAGVSVDEVAEFIQDLVDTLGQKITEKHGWSILSYCKSTATGDFVHFLPPNTAQKIDRQSRSETMGQWIATHLQASIMMQSDPKFCEVFDVFGSHSSWFVTDVRFQNSEQDTCHADLHSNIQKFDIDSEVIAAWKKPTAKSGPTTTTTTSSLLQSLRYSEDMFSTEWKGKEIVISPFADQQFLDPNISSRFVSKVQASQVYTTVYIWFIYKQNVFKEMTSPLSETQFQALTLRKLFDAVCLFSKIPLDKLDASLFIGAKFLGVFRGETRLTEALGRPEIPLIGHNTQWTLEQLSQYMDRLFKEFLPTTFDRHADSPYLVVNVDRVIPQHSLPLLTDGRNFT